MLVRLITRNALSRVIPSSSQALCRKTVAPAISTGTTRTFAINAELKRKEKVEEDRYIKDTEDDVKERRRQAAEEEVQLKMTKKQVLEHEQMEAQRVSLLNSAIQELSSELLKTGDKLSKQGAKNIAIWKLGDQYKSLDIP